MKEVDYLIVGQGIAGTVLAFQLMLAEKSFCIVDKGHEFSSSHVAAGVINPLVLKRMTVSWRAEEFLQKCHSFYPKIDQHLGITSFHPLPLNKLIKSKDEELYWQKRYKNIGLEGFVDYDLKDANNPFYTENFKLGTVKKTAWLDLKGLLDEYRGVLKRNGNLIEEEFEYLELECRKYKEIVFDKIIFCEGSGCTENPFFNHLPFSFNKGDLLTIKAPDLDIKEIYKKKVFVVPLGDSLFRVGATYERDYLSSYDPKLKRQELIDDFKQLFSCAFEIVDQESGLRPSVKDRRPLIGKHPVMTNFYILNGLGSRGCLMAPLLVEEFIDFVEKGIGLDREVNIERFSKA